MSNYDYRDQPAYPDFEAPESYSNNPHILKWWTEKHDLLLLSEINELQWTWPWRITDKIVSLTQNENIEVWKKDDPICSQFAWYNIIMYFSLSRANKLGYTANIRKPQLKICPICNFKFIENSLPIPLIERLGINNIDFCSPCLRDTILPNSGNDLLPKSAILSYLLELSEILEFIPTQGFGENIGDLYGFSFDERIKLINLFKIKPTIRRVKVIFKSWLKALIMANVLPDGTRQTARGTQCLAKDGHVCYSLAEKTIDDMLLNLGIPHQKEPQYPEGQFRGDFDVNGTIIEYFGLIGDEEYDKKIKIKKSICSRNNIRLIEIYPNDIICPGKLKTILLNATAIA